MSGLPRHHILRPRLTAALSSAPVGVVEAGGGYGKSALAAELGATRGISSVVVQLDDRHDKGPALLGALTSALNRAGIAGGATVVAESNEPRAALDALVALSASAKQEHLLVFDDAHHLTGESGALVTHLAQRWPEGHRLLIVARHLPGELRRIRHLHNSVFLDGTDLALTTDEIAQVAARSGVTLSATDAEQLLDITGGWAAAVVLALPILARSTSIADTIARLRRHSHSIAELVDEHLTHLPQAMRAPAARALQLPLITASVVEAATGFTDLLGTAASAGLPITPSRDGVWLLPHPVAEVLAVREPLDADTAHRAAAEYLRIGEAEFAIRVLLDVGDSDGAAAAIERLRPSELDNLGLFVLRGLVARLTPRAVADHPQVLFHVARACEPVAAVRERTAILERLAALAAQSGDAALRRGVQAEQARDLVRDDDIDLGEELASRVLEHAQAEEVETRVRALDVLGRVQAWRRDPESLKRGERLLTEALETCRALGQATWAAQVVLPLAHNVHFARGDFELAIRLINEALAELKESSRHRAVMLTFLCDSLQNAGRYEECAASLAMALDLADRLGDDRSAAYAHWTAARSAAQQGHTATLLYELEATERYRGDWFEHCTGAEFLAEAAEFCDRVGRTDLAAAYAERAIHRREESPAIINRALAAVAARSGDPFEAERALTDAATLYRLEPRERWRITLLRAYAALRRGDARAGALAARAYDEAAAIGHPDLPLLIERTVSDALIELAAASGSAVAFQLGGRGLHVAVTLLGRFGVTRGGLAVAGVEGRPAEVVKVVATLGPSTLDVVSEALWPGADSDGGRQRLRNVLTRIRDAAGDLVIREGTLLKLADDAMVDANDFEHAARRAVALSSAEQSQWVAAARGALARYAGDLLPGDVYADWTLVRRDSLRALFLQLLDLLAAHHAARGDSNEAVQLLERATAADPYEESRYVMLVGIHRDRGATGRAVGAARRGLAAMAELGVRPSAELMDIDKAADSR
jgi:ATP/maltotriose-dependent transcriptional regulator MalT/DNA-binding SARP family transcriptional activator